MTASLLALADQIDPDRIRDLAYRLASVSSPTGNTDAIAPVYAEALGQAGLAVEIRRPVPQWPTAAVVVGRLDRLGSGPTIQFNGHLDHVDVPHPAPRMEAGRIFARGIADMKGAMAAFAEAARVLATVPDLPGNLLVVAHGLHEAPIGHGEDLSALLREGVHGDAVIIGELGEHYLCTIQKGMGIFDITVRRQGEPTHELATPAGTPNPLLLGARILGAIDRRNVELSRNPLPYVGPETYFVGIAEGGDFYNRFPNAFRIVGTRRYAPERAYDEVRAELAALIADATGIEPNQPTGEIAIEYELQNVKPGFRIDADEPILRAVGEAHRLLQGESLRLGGSSTVADGPLFVNDAHVPACYHGPHGHGAHADLEWVDVDELARVARTYVVAAMLYLRAMSA